MKRKNGFTIAELITVVAIIGILAVVAMPIATFGIKRQKEIELHERLRKITNAIDVYHELRNAQGPAAIKKPPDFGQRDLIDPMTGKKEWNTLSDNDDPDTTQSNDENVFEVHSKSSALALDGKTHY